MSETTMTTGQFLFPRTVTMRAFGCMILLPLVAAGQSLDRLQPAPVPPQVEAPASSGSISGEAANRSPKLALPETGETLVAALQGVAFFASPEAAAAAPAGPGASFSDLKPLDTPVFREVVGVYLGRPVTRTLLQEMPTATRLYLAQQGHPFSVVYLPEQDITAGVVRIVVVLSRLESDVAVEGAKFFAPELYRRQFRIDPDAPLSAQALRQEVAWINRNPFRAATVEARPGDQAGTTQLILNVREVRPWRVFAGIANTGTPLTQEEHVNAGVNLGNVFGLGHQASLQATASRDLEALRSVSGSYAIDLPWRHSLSFSGAYSRTNGLVVQPFALKGTSWQVAANYLVPLTPPRAGFTHHLTFGVDFKSSDNNFTFASIPVSDNLTHVVQARASYAGSLQSRLGSTSFGATVTAAPGGLTDRNRDEYFMLSRAGAQARYAYLRIDASQSLPLEKIAPGFSWLVRGHLQVSSSNLVGSEQFQGGGAGSVRGYEEGELYKDNGVLLSQELHLPPWRIPLLSGGADAQARFFVFEDYANLWSTDPLAGETTDDLHSAGVGLNVALGRHANVRAAYGWQFLDSGSSETGANSRLHVAASLSF